MKHKVRSHHWYDGILHIKDFIFETLEEALGFSQTIDAHHIKIYDEDDQVVHEAQHHGAPANTYA